MYTKIILHETDYCATQRALIYQQVVLVASRDVDSFKCMYFTIPPKRSRSISSDQSGGERYIIRCGGGVTNKVLIVLSKHQQY